MKRLLRVTGPNFVAGAEFAKFRGIWMCSRAAPILRWLELAHVKDMRALLTKRRCTWEWL